jgi:8-oxo-dGTP pyrophosphatase MutT (NUDIX family)
MAAHIKMVPFERTESLKTHLTNINPRMLYDVILSKEWDDTFGFNCTEFYEGVHSGQIAFPGGKWETEDENFSVTALRETHEEVGIHPDKMEIIKFYAYLYPSK